MSIFKNVRLFQLLLQLIAVHSLFVGLGLIFLPFGALSWLGFTVDPYRFFSTQGGVFHLVMSIAYWLAAREPLSEKRLLIFIISAKWIALLFLTLYYLFMEPVTIVALSATGDGLMGLAVLLFFLELYYEEEEENERE
ncbi:MAG: hypothetical protein K9N38_09580 [Candidatus Marinimicrobia bacterium]|nr:hypothetical protein [Candidatus Neomarinimicrobiota bacterium]MCF7851381.1 hypothetical protein [Candidatus Neomarinimicrobiota bacterium]